MARDPPSLISSSELRDLSLQPSAVRPARITIIHPQLRDLVLPIERAKLLYPRGTSIEQITWDPEDREEKVTKHAAAIKPIAKLAFTPNCLTASDQVLACGGQHGELYLTNRPASSSPFSTSNNLKERFTSSAPTIKPFALSLTLPTRSINNSLVILPGWPGEWSRRSEERKLGHVGGSTRRVQGAMEEDEDDVRSDGMREDDVEDADALMEIDEDEDEEWSAPSPASSVATYPNTVPFLHAPRIPHLPSPTSHALEIPTTSRRASSFSAHDRPPPSPSRDRTARQSFSSSLNRLGQPPIQYVTSRSPSLRPSTIPRPDSRASRVSVASSSRRRRDEPRLLIANNDQTVKMFSLRPATTSINRSSTPQDRTFWDSRIADFPPPSTSAIRHTADSSAGLLDAMRRNAPIPAPSPRFGSAFGWDAVGINEGLASIEREHEALQRELSRAEDQLVRERDALRRERDDFERVIGMRVGLTRSNQGEGIACPPSERVEKLVVREERKLAKVGGARFKYAINHSSLSPDLRTMVTVGDSTDVYLFEVIDGGREFKRIGTYNAAMDSGFSTAWSKDGRKFAVASQDGQVTVWDHRSSRPLAIFHTSTAHSTPSSPSFTSDLSSSHLRSNTSNDVSDIWGSSETRHVPVLIDPVSGDTRVVTSTSGREAARVVKFSPEGSSRDLMVFSEVGCPSLSPADLTFTQENSHIHIIDARTFHTHVIVPVPHATAPSTRREPRQGVEGGTWGIAGVAFEPTGDWLYSGTEKTVVEWDLRRVGGGEGGTWQMA